MEASVSKVWFGRKACDLCGGKLVKHGFTSSGKTRFKCLNCNKTKVENYTSNAYKSNTNKKVIQLTKEGLGIRSTARILKISTTTLLKRILAIARNIHQPIISKGKIYEVDEMCTFLGHKRNFIWLVYALEKDSNNIVSFNVGKRTNKTLSYVVDCKFRLY